MKNYLEKNVLIEAQERIKIIFDNFDKIYLSFSGGKDSSVMMHLVCNEARKRNKKIGILFIDLEAQYKLTINHIYEMFNEYSDCINIYHVCLPIILRNAVSVYEPRWYCWDKNKKNIWVRKLPDKCISDINYFSFFKENMEFEEFVHEFGNWYSEGKKTVCFVGIRSDESLNRYRAIKNNKKITFKNFIWTTKIFNSQVYNCYPIYDWKTKDIWVYNFKYNKVYNKLYDRMYQAGLSIHQQRICQPYGDDQRKGLSLFQAIEPETWAKIVSRVSGVNSGKEFVKFSGNSSGQILITKPGNHTWKSFSNLILNSMPEYMKNHYQNKIYVYLNWYNKKGYTDSSGIRYANPIDIPDENPDGKEDKNFPSWKRICKMLLRNDYWAKTLSFSQTKTGYFYKKYLERIKQRRLEYIRDKKFLRGYL